MSVKAIAKLTFACFLASCYYSPAPIVIITPSGSPVGSTVPGGTPQQTAADDTGTTTTTTVGNCKYVKKTVQGGFSEECRYSASLPYCTTSVPSCTSNPPSGKCADFSINDPRPCQ